MSFAELAAAKVAKKGTATGMSFKDMCQARFPRAYYHSMNASNISQGVWERNDFPFEKFFQNDVDESAVNWKPNGANPAMDSSDIQSRLHSIAGQKSIVVLPELEENGCRGRLHAGKLKSYIQLCIALSQIAKEVKTASPKPQQNEKPKYAMRTWLLQLGFIRDEFKTARDILTKRLAGNASFRNGRAV